MKNKLLKLCVLGLIAFAANGLNAQQRTWTSASGDTTFRAELVNAYGNLAFFQKEDGGYIHVPITSLARYDVARILGWAQERDAKPTSILMNCPGQAAADIKKQWPQIIVSKSAKDNDANQISEPRLIAFLMIKKKVASLNKYTDELHKAQDVINGKDGHDLLVMAIAPFKGNDMKSLVYQLGTDGDGWLMPNEWQYKDQSDIWTSYWRMPDVSVLITDTDGHVLCDSSAKDVNGKEADPGEFLDSIAPYVKAIIEGGHSVPDPYINENAVKDSIAKRIQAKENHPNPEPIVFDFSGIDPETFSIMEGGNYQVSMEIGTDGNVSNVKLVKGGDMIIEQAFQRAATLWHFMPVMKDGTPEIKTVVAPIRIKAPANAGDAK